jgi:hypothetical protein
MVRVKAHMFDCQCKMKRLYTRAEGGKGWDQIGWMCTCGCGCITMDQGHWNLMPCKNETCIPLDE